MGSWIEQQIAGGGQVSFSHNPDYPADQQYACIVETSQPADNPHNAAIVGNVTHRFFAPTFTKLLEQLP